MSAEGTSHGSAPTGGGGPATDVALLAAQDELQAEAASILADLDLFELIRPVGRPVQTGSSALGLMVARDIDVTTLCPSLETEPIFDVGRDLALHPRVRRVAFRNDTGHWNIERVYPDGLYWMVEYVSDADIAWKLDLWFIHEDATQFDLEHLRSLPPRLTREARLAILRIKHAWHERPPAEQVRSYQIYEAVLDHGVQTPEDFARHLETTRVS